MKREGLRTLAWTAALLAALAFQGFTLRLWQSQDERPPAWDESIHLGVALDYAESLRSGDWTRPLRPAYFNYPPLYHLSLVPALWPAGTPGQAPEGLVRRAVLTQWAYLALLAAALFLIGLRTAGPACGFAAGVFGTASPILAETAHVPLADLALSAWVAWTFYALLLSEGLTRRGPALLAGLFAGLGFLTKTSFVVYVIGPALGLTLHAFRRRRFAGPVAAWGIALALVLPWYVPNALVVLARVLKEARMGAAEGDPSLLSWAAWLYYPRAALSQLHLGLAALAVLGIIAAAARKRWLLLSWALLPMILLNLISNKDLRYSIPCLGGLAVLSAAVFPRKRTALLVGACLAALAGHAVHCFGTSRWVTRLGPCEAPAWDPRAPQRGNWHQSGIVRACLERRDPSDPLTQVTVISNHPFLHSTTLDLHRRLLGLDNLYFRGRTKRLGEMSQFILTKTGELGPGFSLGRIPEAAAFVQAKGTWFERSFRPLREWALPDGSRALLFERSPEPVPLPHVKALQLDLSRASFPRIDTEGMTVTLSSRSNEEARLGRFQIIRIAAQRLNIRGFPLSEVELTLEDAQLNWPAFLEANELLLLRAARARVRAVVPREALQNFSEDRLKGVDELRMSFDEGIRATGKLKGIPWEIWETIRLSSERRRIECRLRRFAVGGIPVPFAGTLLGPFTNRSIPLLPNPEMPLPIEIESLSWTPEELRIR